MTTIHHCTTSTPHSPHTVDRGPWGRGWCPGTGSTPAEPTAVTEDEAPADTEVAGSPDATALMRSLLEASIIFTGRATSPETPESEFMPSAMAGAYAGAAARLLLAVVTGRCVGLVAAELMEWLEYGEPLADWVGTAAAQYGIDVDALIEQARTPSSSPALTGTDQDQAPTTEPYATWDPSLATDEPDGLPDRAIVPLVEALRSRGIVTLQSCAGHLGTDDGCLWVRADSVDGAHLRLFVLDVVGRDVFDRVSLTYWPERRWEFVWRPENAGIAMAALGWLKPAVDAMVGDRAEPAPTSVAADLTGPARNVVVPRDLYDCEPSPEPDSDGKGTRDYWAAMARDRAAERDSARAERDELACVIAEIRDDLGEGSEGELATLAADVRAVRESVKQQLAEVTADRDRWREAGERYSSQREEVRATLAMRTGQLQASRAERDRLRHEAAAFEAMLATSRAELAEATADRDGLREYATTATYHQQRHAEAYREVVRLRGELDDRERQYRDMVDAAERREALIADHRRNFASCVWVDPGRYSGAPCLGGTRIPVSTIAGLLADGLSGDQVRGFYPDVTDEHLVAVRHFVAEVDGTELRETARRDGAADALEWAAGRAERLFGTTTDHPPLLTSPDLRAMAAELRSGERHIGERHIEPRPAAPTATTEPTEGDQP